MIGIKYIIWVGLNKRSKDMKKIFNIGVIGLGCRGISVMKDVLLEMDNVNVVAVCDVYEDRCETASALVKERNDNTPVAFTDYHKMLENSKLDAVFIATSWQTHIEIAIAAMECGVPVASEVSAAFSVQECWDLVKTYERTKTPLMMMENCCYGRDEMMVMNMVKQGILGEIIHCAGGYHHDLRDEVCFGKEKRHYRLDHYMRRNCENYPTHELGPIAQILNINRGNRMLTVNSISSKSAGLQQFVQEKKADDTTLMNYPFAQGDVITTVIKCAGGQTITITLDTTLPRAYSRGFKVQGTKGMFMEDNRSIFLDGVHNEFDFKWKEQFNNVDTYREEYDHPVWKEYETEGVKKGHDGMDWLEFAAFFDALEHDKPMPIDIYDMASWLIISLLSEESIAMGGHPVPVPDFTNGKWLTRTPLF